MSRVQDLLSSRLLHSHNRPPDLRVIDVADDAGEVFQALSSETARQLLTILRDEPSVPPDLADKLDTSIQNVHYHLKNLTEADLVEPIDTWYSEKGVEMKVYAPADNPLVISSADADQRSSLRAALTNLLGAVAILAGLSVAVQWWLADRFTPSPGEQPGPAPIGTHPSGNPEFVPPSGVLFFLGGLIVLLFVSSWWYYRSAARRF